jgi:hypothetical protein
MPITRLLQNASFGPDEIRVATIRLRIHQPKRSLSLRRRANEIPYDCASTRFDPFRNPNRPKIPITALHVCKDRCRDFEIAHAIVLPDSSCA